jgi:hypothetical protein
MKPLLDSFDALGARPPVEFKQAQTATCSW